MHQIKKFFQTLNHWIHPQKPQASNSRATYQDAHGVYHAVSGKVSIWHRFLRYLKAFLAWIIIIAMVLLVLSIIFHVFIFALVLVILGIFLSFLFSRF